MTVEPKATQSQAIVSFILTSLLSKRKPAARKDKIVLLNASRRLMKGRPKNYIPEDDIRPIAAAFLNGEPIENEVAVITGRRLRRRIIISAQPVGRK